MAEGTNYAVKIPVTDGVEIRVGGSTVTAKGSKGEVSKELRSPRLDIDVQDNVVSIDVRKGLKANKKDKCMINTFRAHIRNLMGGVAKGYIAEMKICSGHFPMNVAVDKEKITVKNFLGEKVPRSTRVMEGVSVKVNGDQVVLKGSDKEKVGQTAARIEQVCRITNRDRRIFQDGIWITKKPELEDE